MASFNKFHSFVAYLADGDVSLNAGAFKIYLTNDTPLASSHTLYDGVVGATGPADLPTGNGYTLGGASCVINSSTQTGGIYKLVLGDPPTWTATGGAIGPLRYAVLYEDTSNVLIGWWDYGSVVTINATETITVDLNQTTGVLTLQ